ncbi:BZ3500_MvSof-1268-A1-R1_Chr7-2g09531 [Microbotryum saponariae]|uniref:BZ3500_MvSof-1268-A1-R1_Chr7-2g09531 protein n=1 Tax=Microbotryum saponariae TaxID=289078 RepID=A0A2X0LTM0_9BASI|nr:BZ3501_MvSof-1269-A2-R1_Chr7-1g09231 [Microbotryum saponariae]SDA02643.1 BZ3500_MvSof-1268-A1-R1_Chr7-2g09531 [Microbotryum saponariae]
MEASTAASTSQLLDTPVVPGETTPPNTNANSALDDFLAMHAGTFSEQMFPSWDFQFDWQLDTTGHSYLAFNGPDNGMMSGDDASRW